MKSRYLRNWALALAMLAVVAMLPVQTSAWSATPGEGDLIRNAAATLSAPDHQTRYRPVTAQENLRLQVSHLRVLLQCCRSLNRKSCILWTWTSETSNFGAYHISGMSAYLVIPRPRCRMFDHVDGLRT